MEVKDIKRLLDAVASAGVSEFSYETGDFKLTVKRNQVQGAVAPPSPTGGRPASGAESVVPPPDVAGAPSEPLPSRQQPEQPGPQQHAFFEVTAPIVGTFYTAPAPDAAPYVKVGDRVDEGAVLCIIEAMKLMNEIEAETAGTVVEILVQNEEPVEYGQALFRIDPG